MQRKIGVISPSLPLKSEEEVETAVKRLENYGVSVEFLRQMTNYKTLCRLK